jgi:hypothetical protein
MKREFKKTKQTAVGFLIVVSLFVSSVAACICSHHTEKVEAQAAASCHEHAEAKPETNEVEQAAKFASGEECSCASPAPRVFSKSETIKIEKQASAGSFSLLEIKTVATFVSAGNVYFEKPFYLSDSFYNIKSPRAPPAA